MANARDAQFFVSKYESGGRRLDLLELDDVCRALGVPLVELVGKWVKAVR